MQGHRGAGLLVRGHLRGQVVAGQDVPVQHDDGSPGPPRRPDAALRIAPPVSSGVSSWM